MAWTYDSSTLNTTSAAGRLNVVRFLVGDIDTNDQQAENEVIVFALSENNDNVYTSAAYVSRAIAASYARQVSLNLDDQISAEYGQLQDHYSNLASRLEYQGKKSSASLGMKAGGISETIMETVRQNTDRVNPRIRRDMFNNPPDESSKYYQGDE